MGHTRAASVESSETVQVEGSMKPCTLRFTYQHEVYTVHTEPELLALLRWLGLQKDAA